MTIQCLHKILLYLTDRETLSIEEIEQTGRELGQDLLNSFCLSQKPDSDRPLTGVQVERSIKAVGASLFGAPVRIEDGKISISGCAWSYPGDLPENFCLLVKSSLKAAAELSMNSCPITLKIDPCSRCYRNSDSTVETVNKEDANAASLNVQLRDDSVTCSGIEPSVTMHNLAAEAAHETRNCLATVKGVIELLQLKRPEPLSSIRYYDIISSEIDRASCLLQDLINLSRPVSMRQERVDINELLEETLLLVGKNLFEDGIEIHRNFDRSLPKVTVDPYQIKQTFLNILQNSIQALPRGGAISIGTQSIKEDRWGAAITFKDSGKGISSKHLPYIFNPFYTTKTGGTGLGLTICQRIIDGLGGTLVVKSKEKQGTTVTIKLPSEGPCRDV